MSQLKKDQVFPVKPKAVSDVELAKIVAMALRQDFGDTPSAVKRIGQLTNANLRAIKNWYQARNTPSSGHLLLLARSSPSILKFILMQIGGEDLWDAFRLLSSHALATAPEPEMPVYTDTSFTENVPINVPIKSFNERQRWFLILLKRKNKARAEDIAAHFEVALKTAKRDIEGLKDAGKIRFVGARKTGRYEFMQL
ncbi:MAG: DeoR family transcriptional regulator [Alphaproteobacteria bacterium]|nr:DeoR family transcriptional regulator [Alphaproteobacteria bacterium]